MSSSEIAVASPLLGRSLEILRAAGQVRVHDGAALTLEPDLAAFIGSAEAVVTLLANPVGEEVFRCCPNLRVVANVAVGFDNIDRDAARRHGVWVTNTPDVLTQATADLTLALILAVTRRLVEADDFLRRGEFSGWGLDLLLGRGLQGATLGIVGFGRIGRAVAQRAVAFGMNIVVCDPARAGEHGFRTTDLETLLGLSDIVSLHCPLTEESRGLMTAENFGLMRPGSFFVNTARGLLHDEAALVAALESGLLAGAALDVFEDEPKVHPGLVNRRDVVLVPHIGSATEEARIAMAELAAENAAAVLLGREPPTVVVRPAQSS